MISINSLTVAYGGFVLLNDINFHISESDKIGLVGKNGAGKSTILKLICGLQSPTNGKVAVPNDGTNEGRALKLLEAQGLIKLDKNAGFLATKLDIVENPKNLDIVEMEAAQLPRVLDTVDVAVINGNYAIGAGLKLADALAIEAGDSEAGQLYANIVACANGAEDSEKIQALVKALQSDEVKKFMADKYEGAVVALY